MLAKTFGGPSCGGSRIIEFVGQSGGKFAECAQLVALLFRPAVLSNSIRKYANQPWKQLRNVLEHLLKVVFVQSQNPGGRGCPGGQGEMGHP